MVKHLSLKSFFSGYNQSIKHNPLMHFRKYHSKFFFTTSTSGTDAKETMLKK